LAARQDPRGGAPRATKGEGGTPDDRVIITERKDGTGSGAANGAANGAATGGGSESAQFGDVHFDRDRSTLLAGDMEILRAAVSALKADPTLVVTIEGHTCNLGSAAYNLALGTRRANAVRDYLVSEGVAAERLHIVSYGEKQPKYDNSREETRKLNRRVAVVPGAKP
jgi:peptidoglycan-associated lipoprotein